VFRKLQFHDKSLVHNLTHEKVPEESAVKRVTVEARVIRSEVSVWLFKNGGDLKTGTVPGCNFSRVNTKRGEFLFISRYYTLNKRQANPRNGKKFVNRRLDATGCLRAVKNPPRRI
jgi:hypothetical protein